MKSIVGRKLGMTTVFAPDGTMYPVTVIEVLPNVSSTSGPSRRTATKPW